MPEEVKPLPCPFCGVKPYVADNHPPAFRFVQVQCVGKRCYVEPFADGTSRANAIARWNRRAASKREG